MNYMQGGVSYGQYMSGGVADFNANEQQPSWDQQDKHVSFFIN